MDPLVLGGNTIPYQRLDIGTGWCYHPVLMGVIFLVPMFSLWYWVVLKGAPLVTLKGKYILLNYNCCVCEIVSELHMRQEVMGLNPGHCTLAFLPKDPLVPGHPPGVNASNL